MCGSIQTSLTAFFVSAISMTICLFLLPESKSIKFFALFVMTFATMQLGDAIIWYSLKSKNSALNAFISRYMLLIILLSELLVSYYGVCYFFNWKNKLFEIAMWIFVVIFSIGWFRGCSNDPVTKPNRADGGYLQWCNMSMYTSMKILFVIFFLAPVLFGMPNSFPKYVLLSCGIATFVLHFGNDTFGSRWCWSANVMSVLLLVGVVGSVVWYRLPL